MGRILYIVYLWLFFVPVFLVLTILTAVTVIIGFFFPDKSVVYWGERKSSLIIRV